MWSCDCSCKNSGTDCLKQGQSWHQPFMDGNHILYIVKQSIYQCTRHPASTEFAGMNLAFYLASFSTTSYWPETAVMKVLENLRTNFIVLVNKITYDFFLPEDADRMIPKISSNQGKLKISYFQITLSRYLYKLFLKTLNNVSTANNHILVQYCILSCSLQCFHGDIKSCNDGLY